MLFDREQHHIPLPELILLDWNLPKVSGSEVLRRMKKHKTLRRIPVIVFSASDADSDIHAAYDSHANGYIVKPSSSQLQMIVETIGQFWGALARLPRIAG